MKPIKEGTCIRLKLNGQDGNVTLVCIDRSTQLKKLVKDYCDQHSVEDPTSITFWFDGNGLQGDHCPDEMHMDDEMDTISYDQSAHIKLNLDLNIKDKDGIEVYFNISRSTPLKKLMDFYGYRHCLDINGVAFLFNGRLVTAEQTPDELQMMDGDEIDVVFFDQIARMKLKVKCQDGNEIFFSINKSTHLKKLMNAYCNHHSVDFNSIGFMFNEHHVQAEQSPNEMQMVDGDEIDAIFYDQSRRINLKVKGQVGFEASFGINRSTRLKKLMDVYCCRYCFDFDGVAFLFNGCLVESEQTPDELGMENGDEMLAMLQLICV
ncbi:NFATC2-interacting protein [Medicago truncatula]|uniref:Small ubiquitin-like modifier 3 n=1 Tax=Medicago truncatula TaxID=3880 RepID=G7ZWR8_MEDTR|nr:NFATC2-interacting protein [Medicago truncatula]KEH18064.1 small ubiquitin-like modifier 3 [Medicago truncatula]